MSCSKPPTSQLEQKARPQPGQEPQPERRADGRGEVTVRMPRAPTGGRRGGRLTGANTRAAPNEPSRVVVQRELPRMRPQPHLVRLLVALVIDPRTDQVLREHPALQQELVVRLEGIQGLL